MLLRVEVPIPDSLRDFAPNLEKYKVLQVFSSRKMEIRGIVKILMVLFFKLELLWFFKAKSWFERIINVYGLP